jgi:PAS domain S-box-containing protein
MLGFTDENDLPDILSSWISKIHPDDYDWVFKAFSAHLNDHSGKTPYDVDYRMMMKNGDYRYFHTFGSALRDSEGVPVRVAGAMADIHDKKLLQEKMREADEYINIIFNTMPVASTLWNSNLESLMCNQKALDLYGLSSKEEYRERFFELSPEYQPCGRRSDEMALDLVQKAFENGYERFEWMHQSTDGVLIPAEIILIRIERNGEYRITGYVFDLREHKAALAKIAEESAKIETMAHWYKSILDATPLPITVTDANMNWTFVNTAVENFLGTKREDMMGKSCSNWNAHICNTEDCGIACAKRGLKHTFFTHNGESFQVDVETLKDLAGQTAGFIEVVQNITKIEAMASEKANLLAEIQNEKLRNEEAKRVHELEELQLTKLNLVVQASNIGLWDMDVVKDDPVNPTNTFNWSDEFRHMLGFSNEIDFPNILSSWSDLLHPEDKERTINCFFKHLTDRTGNSPYNIEYRLLKKNGEYGFFIASGESIRDENGDAIRVAGALKDITEDKKTAFELERRREEAETANSAKSAFLAKMSHEIRTPMNAIMGITEMQMQEESLPLETRDSLGRIYNSSSLLLKIINDILDLSKIEAGKLELMPDKYEVSSLLNDTVQIVILQYEDKPIEFVLHVDENMPVYLYGDELRIRQLLNNLLSNAFKYTDSGKITLSVFAEPMEDASEVALVLRVSDTGIGMTPEQVETIFDNYTRFNLDGNRVSVGTGLGMNIVKHLIDLMGGTIDVESDPGKGSIFTVHLPQKNITSGVIGKELSDSLKKFRYTRVSQVQKSQIKREYMPYGSVLVVDDVETNLYVAKLMLHPYGLRIETALSGFETIDKITSGKVYDIILMDHMMPKMDGVETLKKIRSLGYENPVVALTANALAGQKEVFMSHGFDGFISKPVDIRELNGYLNHMIRDKQPREVIEAARRDYERSKTVQQTETESMLSRFFVRDSAKAVKVLESICEKFGSMDDEDYKTYTIQTHAMKTALKIIGETALANTAYILETAGRDHDIARIKADTPAFLEELRTVIERLAPHKEDEGTFDTHLLCEKLFALQTACATNDRDTAAATFAELEQKTWPQYIKEQLDDISRHLLRGENDIAVEIAEKTIRLIL